MPFLGFELRLTQMGVPVTENSGRFGKWSWASGELINMIKWTMGDVGSAFGVHGSALFALGCSLGCFGIPAGILKGSIFSLA